MIKLGSLDTLTNSHKTTEVLRIHINTIYSIFFMYFFPESVDSLSLGESVANGQENAVVREAWCG